VAKDPVAGHRVIVTQPILNFVYDVGMPTSEVSRLAKRWLKAHGDNAIAMARDMVTELEESGNTESAAMWRRVIAEIEKLRRPRAK
jgi:uncharacterized protein (DUF1800 family)